MAFVRNQVQLFTIRKDSPQRHNDFTKKTTNKTQIRKPKNSQRTAQ